VTNLRNQLRFVNKIESLKQLKSRYKSFFSIENAFL